MTRQELSNASAQRSMRLVTESSKLPQCHIDSTLKSKTRKTREREKVYLAWHPCLELRDFLQVFCSPKHSPTMSALAASRATAPQTLLLFLHTTRRGAPRAPPYTRPRAPTPPRSRCRGPPPIPDRDPAF